MNIDPNRRNKKSTPANAQRERSEVQHNPYMMLLESIAVCAYNDLFAPVTIMLGKGRKIIQSPDYLTARGYFLDLSATGNLRRFFEHRQSPLRVLALRERAIRREMFMAARKLRDADEMSKMGYRWTNEGWLKTFRPIRCTGGEIEAA